jgi:transcriptional regulator with XRE-family HTH domain
MLKECPPRPWSCRRSATASATSRVARAHLDELGAIVGVAGSQLSLIENGKREPKLSLLQAIAAATGTDVTDLLSAEPPNRRAALELELERAQQSRSSDASASGSAGDRSDLRRDDRGGAGAAP